MLPDYILRWEAEKMMATMLDDYETKKVDPRHKETQGELAEIKSIVQQGRGMMRLAGWIGSIAGVVWIVIQIRNAVGH